MKVSEKHENPAVIEMNFSQSISDLAFGSAAGIAGKIVEYPFDTVKVRLQTQPLDSKTFKGPWDCISKTLNTEGFFGLYKGFASPLFGSIVENALLFATYQNIVNTIISFSPKAFSKDDLTVSQLCLSGFLSGAMVSSVLTPIELVKCKLQVQDVLAQSHRYSGPIQVLIRTVEQHGLRGLYRGHLGTFLRESVGGAAWFGTYETLCRYLVARSETAKSKDDLSPLSLAGAGAIAGMCFNASLFPADVIKSRQQTSEFTGSKSFFGTCKELYRGEGIRGFYRGLGVTLARSAPASAVIFVTYEHLSRTFNPK